MNTCGSFVTFNRLYRRNRFGAVPSPGLLTPFVNYLSGALVQELRSKPC